jgi:hypothetical protein
MICLFTKPIEIYEKPTLLALREAISKSRKNSEISCFEVLDVLLLEMKASSNNLDFLFMEA